MPLADEIEGFSTLRKRLPLFFLIDTSGSMDGDKIATVNQEMADVIEKIKGMDVQKDVEVVINVLTFDDECRWMYAEPVPVEQFVWNDLGVGGMTCMGEALTQVEKKLHRSAMGDIHASFVPVLIMMSDGWPNDDVESGFWLVNRNNLYQRSLRIAIGIGGDFDRGVLERFTGSPELVAEANGERALKTMIRYITISVIVSSVSVPNKAGWSRRVEDAIRDAYEEIDRFYAMEGKDEEFD